MIEVEYATGGELFLIVSAMIGFFLFVIFCIGFSLYAVLKDPKELTFEEWEELEYSNNNRN